MSWQEQLISLYLKYEKDTLFYNFRIVRDNPRGFENFIDRNRLKKYNPSMIFGDGGISLITLEKIGDCLRVKFDELLFKAIGNYLLKEKSKKSARKLRRGEKH